MPSPDPSYAAVAKRLCGIVASERLSPGDLASLRRLTAHSAPDLAFWKVMCEMAPGEVEKGSDRVDARWAVVLQALATMRGFHAPERPLGAALAEAGLSELRFSRLLRADEDRLPTEIRAIATFLASKGQRANHVELALLVLHPDGEGGERIRRRVARSYFRPAPPDAE